MLQSSCSVKARGEQISRPGFRTAGWHAVTVPSTVVAALVADGTFPDPYFGDNLRSIPGTTYPIWEEFLSACDAARTARSGVRGGTAPNFGCRRITRAGMCG